MPIFEYQCDACGHRFDVLQKLSDQPPDACPDCGGESPRKQLSAPNFHLKGGGWRSSRQNEKPAATGRPKFAHTFDSATPHGDHHGHNHKPGQDHGHHHASDNKHTHDD